MHADIRAGPFELLSTSTKLDPNTLPSQVRKEDKDEMPRIESTSDTAQDRRDGRDVQNVAKVSPSTIPVPEPEDRDALAGGNQTEENAPRNPAVRNNEERTGRHESRSSVSVGRDMADEKSRNVLGCELQLTTSETAGSELKIGKHQAGVSSNGQAGDWSDEYEEFATGGPNCPDAERISDVPSKPHEPTTGLFAKIPENDESGRNIQNPMQDAHEAEKKLQASALEAESKPDTSIAEIESKLQESVVPESDILNESEKD